MAKSRTRLIRANRSINEDAKMSHARVVNEVLLQPWFLPQKAAFAIHGLVPTDFRKKMGYYFEDYGCMICKVESGYHSNGMCVRCCQLVRKRLAHSVARRSESGRRPRLDLAMFRQERIAKKLLSKFSDRAHTSQRRSVELPAKYNPVYAALAARSKSSE
jgi:hypothetical protein